MNYSWSRTVFRSTGPCALLLLLLFGGCTREPPVRTVVEFVDNPRMLEAAMLRCAENRLELKYTEECLNAREAVDRLAAQEDAARREELEAQSTRKREALRRAQEAAVEARSRAAELERQRREAEYLGQFDETGDATGESGIEPPPLMPRDNGANAGAETYAPPPDNAPMAAPTEEPATAEPDSDSLESVREELQRRQQEADNQ